MKIPRNLKGSYLGEVLCKSWDYQIIHQEGSHIILEIAAKIRNFKN